MAFPMRERFRFRMTSTWLLGAQETLDRRSEEKHVAELLEVADEWADSDRNGRKKKISGSWDAESCGTKCCSPFGVDHEKETIDKQSIAIGLLLRNTMSPCDVSEVITTSISPSWTTAVRTSSFRSGWSQRVFVSQNKIVQRAGMKEMMKNV